MREITITEPNWAAKLASALEHVDDQGEVPTIIVASSAMQLLAIRAAARMNKTVFVKVRTSVDNEDEEASL